ncbi:hypothetical protein EBT16_03635 [bacterium]|nr:hypothetical protein [bacterium]
MEDDIDIDDIFHKKPKKIKSGKKGKRVELELVKNLNERFSKVLAENPEGGKFSRSIGSGNRWSQNVHLSRAATNLYSGDIVCPEKFRFVLESKGGYNDIDLCSAFEGGQSELDEFLKQVSSDSERCKRKPMLFWKKDRKPRIAFIRSEDLGKVSFKYAMKYREWTAVAYEDLMGLDDSFFFS